MSYEPHINSLQNYYVWRFFYKNFRLWCAAVFFCTLPRAMHVHIFFNQISSSYHLKCCLLLPRSKKKTDLFFKKIAPYASSKIKNHKRSKKLLKRRFIWDQEQVSSFIRLEVIKKSRGGGQNSQLQKTSVSERFLAIWVVFILT